ncbi:MAG TPA: UPF0182 family protein, partial [Promineifilum sp.]
MKPDDFDIPEVFRRAMEEAGWQSGREEGEGRRPPRRPRTLSARPYGSGRLLIFAGLILLLFFSLGSIATFYTDFLWFQNLGFRDMFAKRLAVRAVVFVVALVIALGVLLGNWLFARRRALRDVSADVDPIALAAARYLLYGLGVVLGFLFAVAAAAQWEELLLYLNAVPFDLVDPVFGRDVGFYVFQLPVYRYILGWLTTLLMLALIGIVPIYALPNIDSIRGGRWRIFADEGIRRHFALLGGVLLLLWAAGYVVDMFDLLYSSRGVSFGANYTDLRVSLWALRLQLVFMVMTAFALFANYFRSVPRWPLVTSALLLATTLLAGRLAPEIFQRYVVEPNELTLETPYIQNNIALTRRAFDLEKIESQDFGQVEALQPRDLLENDDVLANIRLWDWRPLLQTYRQLQGLRPYYEFYDVDVDRYLIDGKQRQVMIGPRELDKTKLPAPSWVNLNLEFTHGYGLVMNPVNDATADGQPEFFIKDFPPQSSVEIEVTRPEIYYGELTDTHVFVGSGREEFDYPSGDANVYSSYAGTGGIPLDSFGKRLAFALRNSDPNVLLSDDITDTTRIQFRRQIRDRITELTPFLVLDGDPYLVIDSQGRLIWIQDAYTVSNAFPYSTPLRISLEPGPDQATASGEIVGATRSINYMRNSVKVTVDAYNGDVTYYLFDDSDPIILSYARAFPGVFRPGSDMPEDLVAHLRYPEDYFFTQARQYLTYHMTDVRVFYNKEDLWQVPNEVTNSQEMLMEPYYVTLPLPGSDEPEYLLILPFSPATRNNMIGWMAARMDPGHYGELRVYELPKQELIFGPIQVEGRIDQEPVISQQFSLWNQQGSSVIRGNLLVLPINQSFLYIEPVYLISETSALPELKRIVTASNSAVAMDVSLSSSLLALSRGVVSSTLPAELQPPANGQVPETPTITADPGSVEELVAAANAHLAAAEEAQRQGDWSLYGRELEALRATLDLLATL